MRIYCIRQAAYHGPMNTSTRAIAPARQVPPLLMLMTLAIGFVMAMIDVTAVNTALSDISVSLSVPLTGLVWVVDGYTLTFAALLMAGGGITPDTRALSKGTMTTSRTYGANFAAVASASFSWPRAFWETTTMASEARDAGRPPRRSKPCSVSRPVATSSSLTVTGKTN